MRQLRFRAETSRKSASVIFVVLILAIALGIAWYIGRPILTQFLDAERRVSEETIRTLTAENETMDAARNALAQTIANRLRPAGRIVPSGTENDLLALSVLPDGTSLVAVGADGAITRSTDKGATWATVSSGTERILYGLRALPDGTTLVAVGEGGAIIRSTDKGATWAAIPSGTQNALFALSTLPDGTTLVAVGLGGAITRSTDSGATWVAISSGAENHLFALSTLPDGTTLVAVGADGAIIRSTDKGATWAAIPSGTKNHLFGLSVLRDGTTLVAVGNSGTIVVIDDTLSEVFAEPLPPLLSGDAEFSARVDQLNALHKANPIIAQAISEFPAATTTRAAVAAGLAEAERNLADSWALGFTRSQQAEDFANFMEACRGDKDYSPETSTACAEAYAARAQASRKDVWTILAEQVPPGILFLFLLATLAGLYRYNLRLAGFHHSRADALELLTEEGLTKAQFAALNDLSISLAADKVDFRGDKTPSDQAAEIAKSVFARAPK